MEIDTLEAIQAGGSTQWIRIRGADASNPVLLLIQQGPGLPMINEARRFGHLLGLEQAFTVVYWDQRGCGRSLRGRQDRAGIGVERMAADTVSLLEFLGDRFGAKTYVAGFSFGGTVGAAAAARRPDLVATLVAVGMDIDGAAAGTAAYDFALAAARQRGSRRATRQLQAIGHDRRNLRQPGTRTARQPGALTGLFGRGCLPDRPRYQRDTSRAAARARGHGPGPHPAPPGGARRHGAGPP
jgi:pimeloyl-ACP methyl ester carboxylesterase